MVRLQKAEMLADARGHKGQRRTDFITGFLIAHDPSRKGSARHSLSYGFGRRNIQMIRRGGNHW